MRNDVAFDFVLSRDEAISRSCVTDYSLIKIKFIGT